MLRSPTKATSQAHTYSYDTPLGLSAAAADQCAGPSCRSCDHQSGPRRLECHRLSTSTELGVLQCGDPTGIGAGGPGYRFPNEYPTNQYRLTDPALKIPVLYPRGTLAMANSGPGTNGSQFFLVYEDSQLPPTYTVFGTIDSARLATLEKVAAAVWPAEATTTSPFST